MPDRGEVRRTDHAKDLGRDALSHLLGRGAQRALRQRCNHDLYGARIHQPDAGRVAADGKERHVAQRQDARIAPIRSSARATRQRHSVLSGVLMNEVDIKPIPWLSVSVVTSRLNNVRMARKNRTEGFLARKPWVIALPLSSERGLHTPAPPWDIFDRKYGVAQCQPLAAWPLRAMMPRGRNGMNRIMSFWGARVLRGSGTLSSSASRRSSSPRPARPRYCRRRRPPRSGMMAVLNLVATAHSFKTRWAGRGGHTEAGRN